MKRSKKFRRLQQKVLNYTRRGVNLTSDLDIKMLKYITTSQAFQGRLTTLADLIEKELKGE